MRWRGVANAHASCNLARPLQRPSEAILALLGESRRFAKERVGVEPALEQEIGRSARPHGNGGNQVSGIGRYTLSCCNLFRQFS
jgi:hypothetical protein